MPNWKVELVPEAVEDFNGLDGSLRKRVLKRLVKLDGDPGEGIDPDTERFLQRVRNAPRLGRVNEPLNREDLYEEMVNRKY